MSTVKQTAKKNEQYFALHLWDASMPGICSFDKMYIGTEEDIKRVAQALKDGEHYPDTVKAIQAYFEGNTAATHNVAYREIPILIPVPLKAKRSFTMKQHMWEHLNVWEWPYNMKFDGAEITQIIIKYKDEYHRCFRAKIKNLQYETPNGRYDNLDKMHWGNDFVLNVEYQDDGFTIENILYIGEVAYAKLKDAKADFQADKVLFDGFCDEIFGDG